MTCHVRLSRDGYLKQNAIWMVKHITLGKPFTVPPVFLYVLIISSASTIKPPHLPCFLTNHGFVSTKKGYGSLGRETARLLKAHGMRIIAANTSGKATPQDGYIIPGTGDKDGTFHRMLILQYMTDEEDWAQYPSGSIPEAFYSTKDPKSVKEFLNQCDVLVANLPNTPDTQHFLNKEKLGSFSMHNVLEWS